MAQKSIADKSVGAFNFIMRNQEFQERGRVQQRGLRIDDHEKQHGVALPFSDFSHSFQFIHM